MAALIPKTFLQAAKTPGIGVVAAVQVCNYSQKPRIIKNPTTANLKRGTGGRSSFNGIVCTVFGGNGFIGKHVINRLGKIGTQVIIPYRKDFYDVQSLKICGDLGQILFHPFDLRDEDSILKCIKYSNVVINCIGNDWETKNFTFEDVHVEGAARLARICKQNGVERFIHLSCLNAGPEPEKIFLEEGSKFLKSKWEGEWAVKKEFPDATIIRPSDVYGTEDRFLAVWSHRLRLHMRGVPVAKNKGEDVQKQPVWIGDVAAGVVATARDYRTAGRTYQFVGSNRYKLSDLLDWFHEMLRRDSVDFGYRRMDMKYTPLFKAKVTLIEALSPAFPVGYLHWEGLERQHISDVVIKGVPTLEDLGIVPVNIESQLPWEISPHRYDGYYEVEVGEYPDIIPPKPVPSVLAN